MYLEEQFLKEDDRPTQIKDLNYADTFFYLRARNNFVNPQIKKQLDIVVEIIESELKYTEDLKLINSLFIESLAGSGIISELDIKELFININDLIHIHENICAKLSKSFTSSSEKILNLINCYIDNVRK